MFRVFFLILFLFSSVALSFIPKPISPIQKSISPVPKPTSPLVLDIIGKSSDKDLIARFVSLKLKLSEETTAKAYIINYGTEFQIRKRERQIRKALAFNKIDSKRVVIVRGKDIDHMRTEIYILPEDVEPPSI
jgi:hypothetical protein